MTNDRRVTMEEMLSGMTELSGAMQGFGVTAQEFFDNLGDGLKAFFETLKKECPECFDGYGNLRDDWLMIYGATAKMEMRDEQRRRLEPT